jgi:hypothetical protein
MQPLCSFPAFYGTRRFITAFTRALHLCELGTTLAVTIVFLRSMRQLLVSAKVVPSSLILVTLMMEAKCFSGTSVLTRAPRRHNPEGCILQMVFFWGGWGQVRWTFAGILDISLNSTNASQCSVSVLQMKSSVIVLLIVSMFLDKCLLINSCRLKH